MIRTHFTLALCLSSLLAVSAFGHSVKPADNLEFHDAWMRATKGAMMRTAGYLTIENTGSTDRRLVTAKIYDPTDLTAMVSIHETIEKDGVFSMQPLKDGLILPAGEKTVLKPKGLHLMLMELNQKLAAKARVMLELQFKDGDKAHISFEVKNLTNATDHTHKQAIKMTVEDLAENSL